MTDDGPLAIIDRFTKASEKLVAVAEHLADQPTLLQQALDAAGRIGGESETAPRRWLHR